jgi:hypothetical protein
MSGKKKKSPTIMQMHKAAKRKAHFSSGGTVAMWRGRAATLDEGSSKARKNKRACRDWKQNQRGDE